MPDRFFEPSPPPDPSAADGNVWKKIGWFVALAIGGVTATAGLAYVLRALLFLG
ncbi:MAG: hypothetical protein AAFQ84_02905 [Pseudomonadota bacterium]